MAARDDYPALAEFTRIGSHFSKVISQGREALNEIDRLRKASEFHRGILDDVLPTVTLSAALSIMQIDGRWMRVLIEPKEPT